MSKPSRQTIRQLIDTSPELVELAITQAQSLTHVLRILDLASTNTSARKTVKSFADSKGISIPAYDRKLAAPSILDKNEVLTRFIKSDKHYGSILRIWVLRFDLLEYKCAGEDCLISEGVWLNKPLVLDLDHINGDNTDNRVENLRFLCPNCHSQTKTYKGRNIRVVKQESNVCPLCSKDIAKTSKTCIDCMIHPTKTTYPPTQKLLNRLAASNYEKVASELNVSANAVRKHLRKVYGSAPTVKQLKLELKLKSALF